MAPGAAGGEGGRRPSDAGLGSPSICHVQSCRSLLRRLSSSLYPMNTALVQVKEQPVEIALSRALDRPTVNIPQALPGKLRARIWLAVPVAATLALAIHLSVSKSEPPVDTHNYSI